MTSYASKGKRVRRRKASCARSASKWRIALPDGALSSSTGPVLLLPACLRRLLSPVSSCLLLSPPVSSCLLLSPPVASCLLRRLLSQLTLAPSCAAPEHRICHALRALVFVLLLASQALSPLPAFTEGLPWHRGVDTYGSTCYDASPTATLAGTTGANYGSTCTSFHGFPVGSFSRLLSPSLPSRLLSLLLSPSLPFPYSSFSLTFPYTSLSHLPSPLRRLAAPSCSACATSTAR